MFVGVTTTILPGEKAPEKQVIEILQNIQQEVNNSKYFNSLPLSMSP